MSVCLFVCFDSVAADNDTPFQKDITSLQAIKTTGTIQFSLQ